MIGIGPGRELAIEKEEEGKREKEIRTRPYSTTKKGR